MNPAEQKSHKNVTDTLRADLKQLSDDFDVLDKRAAQSTKDLRTEHDDRISCVALDLRAFALRGFWSRLNWLVTGR
jgi:hypothetical protein